MKILNGGVLLSSIFFLQVLSFVFSLTLENGHYYAITSISSGKVVSGMGDSFSRGAGLITSNWLNSENQKYLAIFTNSGHQMKNGNISQHFLLVPKRQRWEWKLKMGKIDMSNITAADLPDYTMVLSLDPLGNLTQEIFKEEDSSQRWISEDILEGRVYIRNVGNNQCLKNFDVQRISLLKYARLRLQNLLGLPTEKFVHPLGVIDCNYYDPTLKWILQLTS